MMCTVAVALVFVLFVGVSARCSSGSCPNKKKVSRVSRAVLLQKGSRQVSNMTDMMLVDEVTDANSTGGCDVTLKFIVKVDWEISRDHVDRQENNFVVFDEYSAKVKGGWYHKRNSWNTANKVSKWQSSATNAGVFEDTFHTSQKCNKNRRFKLFYLCPGECDHHEDTISGAFHESRNTMELPQNDGTSGGRRRRRTYVMGGGGSSTTYDFGTVHFGLADCQDGGSSRRRSSCQCRDSPNNFDCG